MPIEPGEQTDLHVVQRARDAEVVEALLAERAPEALHLAARLRVVRLGVHEPDTKATTRDTQRVADVGRAVVEIERLGRAVETKGLDAQSQHLGLALGGASLEWDHVPAVVIENRVDAKRHAHAVHAQRRAVADVSVPNLIGRGGLPPKAHPCATHTTRALETVLAVETTQRRHADATGLEAAIDGEGAVDERDTRGRVLVTDREEQHALFVGESACVARVAAALRTKRVEAATTVRVVPALQRRHGVGARARTVGWTYVLVGECAQLGRHVAVIEHAATQQRAEHLRAKQRHLLGDVFGFQLIGHRSSFRERNDDGRGVDDGWRLPRMVGWFSLVNHE